MPRPRKKISTALRETVDLALEELNIADQIAPLMFDRDHMAVLLSLKCAHNTRGLPFTVIGDVADLGKSQKLVDILLHLTDHGFVEKNNGKYVLTDFGLSAANFAEKVVTMINEDPDIAKKSEIAGNIAVVKSVEQKYNEHLDKKIKETT